MKTPRDLSGKELVRALQRIGYQEVRQKGSHVYLTTTRNGEHHIAVPLHNPLKIGTLMGILSDVAQHLDISRPELQELLFG